MRRSLRPNQIEDRFVTAETTFVDLAAWDQRVHVHPDLTPQHSAQQLPIWIGVDASTKHDSTAIVACSFDNKAHTVRVVAHRIFQPSPNEPLDFEGTIEATLLDLKKRFRVRKVYYDPFQMAASAQRMTKAGLKLEEFPQTRSEPDCRHPKPIRLNRRPTLITYPDAAIRVAVSRAVAVESTRGWRIAKDKARFPRHPHLPPAKAKSVTHVSGTKCHLCLGPLTVSARQ
jgi:phage terminase large subunit-like protein